MNEEQIIEERKRKLFEVLKKEWVLISIFLIFLVVLGCIIRYQPLAIHETGKSGLWDITTNDYTLGPDLDPWLFTRYAKTIIETGGLPQTDMMRNTPLGFNTKTELQMIAYMIVLTYKVMNTFGQYSENFCAAFMPVWIFGLTIIAFFFFVREIFIKRKRGHEESELEVLESEGSWLERNNLNANLIAGISTLFMITIPIFLSRTVAGIPEKESVGFLFMFLTFFLFLKAWKAETFVKAGIYGILSGVASALMGLTWGGVTYIYITMGLSAFIAFLLNKFNERESLAYSLWLIVSLIVTLIFTNRFSIKGFLTGIDTGLCFLVFLIIVVDYILWKTKLNIKILDRIKLPKNVISILVTILIGIILILLILGPSFFIEKIDTLNKTLIKPVTGRWSTTVAENKQPYFTEWEGSFGPVLFNIPLLFWMFFLGSILLFKRMLKKIDRYHAWILTGLYVLFFFGLVFSRYSGSSVFNGESSISKLFYYGSALLLAGFLFYYYTVYFKKEHKGFEEIDFSLILLFSLFAVCLFTARSAVRLIMVLGPIAPIFAAFALVYMSEKFLKSKDETNKTFYGVIAAILILASVFSLIGIPFTNNPGFYQITKSESYYFIPGAYNQQWQKAMEWVRTETPKDAVFSHWWDYGYWVQSIGNRATMVDGGNAIVYWNYLVGRYVLTGDNEKDALDLLYAHNVSYFLIDSSDIGKYGAFAQIGSDANFDRISNGPLAMISPTNQRQEVSDGTIFFYMMPAANGQMSIAPIEEDVIYEINGTKTTLMKEKTGFVGTKIKMININNETKVGQPIAVFFSQNSQKQTEVPMRYLYDGNNFYDFKTGIESAISIIPRLNQDSSGKLGIDPAGACIWVSPRILRGFLGQAYVLNDPFNKFTHFKIIHQQSSPVTEALRAQGVNIGEWVYFNGLQGPITIWKVSYSGNEKIRQEFIDTDTSKYLNWEL